MLFNLALLCCVYINIYLFSLRNFTRIILQGIGSQKIGSLAFRDSWALVHHFKTSINYDFEEVIIINNELFVKYFERECVSIIISIFPL
jgi:hypothetical protein